MLVLDARHKKIFTYSMETDPPTRLDNHHNDRAAATKKDIEGDSNADGIYRHGEQGADDEYGPTAGADGIRGNDDDGESDDQIIVNADDFFLFKTNAPAAPEGHLESEKARDSRQYPYGGRDYKDNPVSVLPLLPNPYGIWSDGTTLWVSDFDDDKIYAYDLSWHQSPIDSSKKYAKGTRASGKDVNTLKDAENEKPHGLWVHRDILWVADNGADKIFAYNWPSKTRNSSKDITLTHKDAYAQGIWSNGTNIWVANIEGIGDDDEQIIYAYNWPGSRDEDKDFETLSGARNDRPRGIWSDNETISWVANVDGGRNLYAYNLPQPTARGGSGPSEDASFEGFALERSGVESRLFPEKTYYTAQVDHTVNSTTVTATPNDSGAVVEILWSRDDRSATARTANRGRQVALSEGYNFIAVDVTAENGDMQSYIVWVTKSEAPPTSGGPLPQPQSFQPSATSSASQADLAGSSIGLGEGESRLIFAESLPNGGVRFVFLVPAEEFQMEETDNLLAREWRPLPEDKFQSTRESLGDGQDRLTIILPEAAGKQRFLRLSPQR